MDHCHPKGIRVLVRRDSNPDELEVRPSRRILASELAGRRMNQVLHRMPRLQLGPLQSRNVSDPCRANHSRVWIGRWWTAVALSVVASLTGCGGEMGEPTFPPEHLAGLAAYQQRCASLDQTLPRARIVYEAAKSMTRGNSEPIAAAVTLDTATPADEILHRTDAAEEPGYIVSCRLQARLRASSYQFEVDDREWVERSLLTTDTAHWSWYVTPKIGGVHTLVLQLRPVVTVQPQRGAGDLPLSGEESNIVEYETRVHVTVPWVERPQETMSRLASTFNVAEEMVGAVTGFVVALIALLAALGVRRARGRPRGDATPS
jgi:hypothetical protein